MRTLRAVTLRTATLRAIIVGSLLIAGIQPAIAGYKSNTEAKFQRWIGDLWPQAKAAGISRSTFKLAFKGVRLNWKMPDLAPPGLKPKDTGKRRQAEFGSPGRYFHQNNLNALVRRGRTMAKKWKKTLGRIEQKYGVQQNVVLAVWGRETSFGAVRIPYDTIRSLATLSFMGRRKSFFHPELIGALKILEEGHISRGKLKSSWAGAMGQTQMLPRKFLKYAVDFDGDGRKNIWTSPPDALATTARFLKAKGWNNNYSWGYEVAMPKGYDCSFEGPHRAQPIANWVKSGLHRTRSRQFSNARKKTKGSLLLPAGAYGPAFVVTKNFYVIKTYNESDLYALFVGHLADRISTNKPFDGKWKKVSTYTRAKVKVLQKTLRREGYNIGDKIDGLIGFRSRVAIGSYQHKHGLKRDCWPGKNTFKRASR